MKTMLRLSVAIAIVSLSPLALAQGKPAASPQPTWGAGTAPLAPLPGSSATTPPAVAPSADASLSTEPAAESPASTASPTSTRPAIEYVPAAAPTASTASTSESKQEISTLQDRDMRRSFWKIGMGVRGGRVDHPGFNPFANNSQLWQYSLTATRTLFASQRFSFAMGASWDVGTRSDNARGFDTGIVVHRLSVPLEGRYHAAPWLYAFARVAPGADYRKAWITDPSASTGELDSSAWAFAADFSLGASFLVGPQGKPDSHVPRVWFTPELGYAWSGSTDLSFAPRGADADPQPTGTTDLGALAIRGPFVRLSIDLSF
ncbi:MAG: hypothetical protein ABI551_17310 [Polyangiaceae bacterium]